MKTKMFMLACVMSGAFSIGAIAQVTPKSADKANDKKFEDSKIEDDAEWAVKAADGGMLEVRLGELAQKKGSSQQIRDLGKLMVQDHAKANAELKAIANKKGITLPTKLSDKSQKKFDELMKKEGADFDKAYAELMIKDHKDDIDSFQKEADKGKDGELKSWASGKISMLKHHLSVAEQAQDAAKI